MGKNNGFEKRNGHRKSNGHAKGWMTNRWEGVERPYTQADVERLRGTVRIDYTLARLGAERLW
jgi:isocitrate lyase